MPDSDARDRELMDRLAGGDSTAMEHLVDRWQRPLLSFIYRYVQDRETARELVQETFLRVYRARERFDPRYRFSGWIFRIAANLCRNHLRWRRRHAEVALESDDEAPHALPERLCDSHHPAALATRDEERLALRRAIARMPHALKTALLLHYFEELSYREIANVLGCSERGVESRLYRARKWLAARLPAPSNARATAAQVPELSTRSSKLFV